jgi:hypothetical protein
MGILVLKRQGLRANSNTCFCQQGSDPSAWVCRNIKLAGLYQDQGLSRTNPARVHFTARLSHIPLALVVCSLSLDGRMPNEATLCPSERKHCPGLPHSEPLKTVQEALMLPPDETAARDTGDYCTQRLK